MNSDDENSIPRAPLILGLAGALPFWALALVLLFSDSALIAAFAVKGGIAYGAVILSFLGGIRWGEALKPYGKRERAFAFTLSVVPSLAGWAALLMPAIPALSLLVAGFLMQSLWDVTSAQEGRLPGWFGKLRAILTSLAVTALILMLGRLLLIA
jgi:hypothetical protein